MNLRLMIIMIRFLIAGVLFYGISYWANAMEENNRAIERSVILEEDSLPAKNKLIVEYVIQHGREISPNYQSSVCTELVIGVLKHFTVLSKEEKNRIRIITDENIHKIRLTNSPIPKGVSYALTESKKGIAINDLKAVRPGDFVQFWYWSWGHCGIVKSIDIDHYTMELYSSYPTTNGYGIQTFNIPSECYFVRLK